MKHFVITLFFITLCQTSLAQNFILKINGSSDTETKTIDSLNYNGIHKTKTSIENETIATSKKLESIGYLNPQRNEIVKINDSVFSVLFQLNKQTKYSYIYVGKNEILKKTIPYPINNDTLILKYTETPAFLEKCINQLDQLGYPLAKLQLTNIKNKDNRLIANLNLKINNKRKITRIVLKTKDVEKKDAFFPNNHLQQINKKFKDKLFNQKALQEIELEFDKYPFATQTKKPELLFTQDSTTIYVYLEKRKNNSFDGYIGLGNNEEKKTTLNGYLNIQLQNLLKKGEDFFVYWKSDGNDQKTFRTGITLNYLFKTPLGLNAQLHIFKQDSTFQNSKTFVDLNYNINYSTKLYLGLESTVSSDIQNSNNIVSDYKNQFITTGVNYTKNKTNNIFFQEKTKIDLRLGTGKRNTVNQLNTTANKKQYFLNLNISHNFDLNPKNSINVRSQNYYLKSDTYLTNELFRFGGLYSIRGFAENSLQGNQIHMLLTEYRYIINTSLYIHSILDYALYQDHTLTNIQNFNKISSIGLGLGIQTNNGLLNISLTNGRNSTPKAKTFNNILAICYNVKF
ncbi:MAG: hypothetical protein ACRC6O_00080 [Flavobacterium sp.]